MEVADGKTSGIKVVMLPWLAHGHISPFLELAKKLAQRNFHIYLCTTPVNLDLLKPKLSNSNRSIQLVELHLPSLPELPPHYHTTKGLPPHLVPVLRKASDMSGPNVSDIIAALKPDLVIYDFHAIWITDIASSLNIPAVVFIPMGAAMIATCCHFMKHGDREFPFPEFTSNPQVKKTTRWLVETTDEDSDVHGRSTNIILINSLRELEAKCMDYLSASYGLKIVPAGLLVPDPSVHQDDEGLDIINWLDKKDKSSTVFVSFGSELYLSKDDMEAIALGLELSTVNFVWVVRFPKGEEIKLEEALPQGFLERVRDRGLVVEDWAPQVKILNHPSIGGFVSHCGWGSVMESLKFGVPIVAMPMQIDQPWNAIEVVMAGVGLEAERDINSGRLEGENVAKVIRKVVKGEDMKRKAREMSNCIFTERRAKEDMDVVEQEILKVCGI